MTVELMLATARSFLFVLAAMLPILNPAATAPIFLSMTEGASPATRILLARRIARNMFWLMTGSMLVGSYVLDFFGISLPIVRVGGGLILASVAWRLLGATPTTPDSRASLAEAFTPDHAHRQAFYPLTFPISCGPASISVAITVGVSLHDTELVISLARMSGALLALAVIGVLLPLMVLTGLTMSPGVDAALPVLVDIFGGRQSARTIHFLTASFLMVFVIVHIAMVILSGTWNNIRSMITGRYAIKEKDSRP